VKKETNASLGQNVIPTTPALSAPLISQQLVIPVKRGSYMIMAIVMSVESMNAVLEELKLCRHTVIALFAVMTSGTALSV